MTKTSFCHPLPTLPDCDVYLQSLALKEKVNPMKFKERSSEDSLTCRSLLLWMVRLIHADPMLMLNVSDGPETPLWGDGTGAALVAFPCSMINSLWCLKTRNLSIWIKSSSINVYVSLMLDGYLMMNSVIQYWLQLNKMTFQLSRTNLCSEFKTQSAITPLK